MLELCDIMLDFYPKEIGKIGERIDHFKRVRKMWEKKKRIILWHYPTKLKRKFKKCEKK